MKKLVAFDLDGTLAQSKSAIDDQTAALLVRLLQTMRVAIISGGDTPQFEQQVLGHLAKDAPLTNLSILPTCGTKFLQYREGWHTLYSEDLSSAEKQKIEDALNSAVAAAGFKIDKVWGEQIQDRGTQVTYSALGQQAPLDEKSKWDPDFAKRKKIEALLAVSIPEFSVESGGTTSIDVTRLGIDKAYGMRKLRDVLGIPIDQMIYVGDALFPGGNDYPVRSTGAVCIQVRDPNETKVVIETILALSF